MQDTFYKSQYPPIFPKMLLASSVYFKPQKAATITKNGEFYMHSKIKVNIPINSHLGRFSMTHSFVITIKTVFSIVEKHIKMLSYCTKYSSLNRGKI